MLRCDIQPGTIAACHRFSRFLIETLDTFIQSECTTAQLPSVDQLGDVLLNAVIGFHFKAHQSAQSAPHAIVGEFISDFVGLNPMMEGADSVVELSSEIEVVIISSAR